MDKVCHGLPDVCGIEGLVYLNLQADVLRKRSLTQPAQRRYREKIALFYILGINILRCNVFSGGIDFAAYLVLFHFFLSQ
ncbi:hypothetical protein EJR36_07585, partial [Salmonella enterica]|nr:hypothetical protein [Salmonella enterica]